ncbi:MAG: hypothetical protein HYS13_25540 [Planctomycetia bacterium]|nr:hypothetical protein [Planctomycetia bacterium]
MALSYVKHEPISLRNHPDFSEAWLQKLIVNDTTMLGLGDLEVISREHVQFGGGRLDLLLADPENGIRYEVELMLGPTDPSHIIRTIEYWDIERRRYPAYDHIAVLVAEAVTSRFLNVLSLMSGSIPLIAIQLNAMKFGEQIMLDFVKVLDQRQLREDDTVEAGSEDVDRATWDERVGTSNMQVCDRLLSIANEVAHPKLELKYKKRRIGLSVPGQFFNSIAIMPKKSFVAVRIPVSDADAWTKRLTDGGLDAALWHGDRVQMRISSKELTDNETLLRPLIHQAVKEHEVQ